MSYDRLFAAAHLFLHNVLVNYFDLIKHEIKYKEIHFYFTEFNESPNEYKGVKLHSKGVFPKALFKISQFEETLLFYA